MSKRKPGRAWSAPAMPFLQAQMREYLQEVGRHRDVDVAPVIARLDRAELFWVAPKMVDLAVAAAPELPDWTPALALPADDGLMLWAKPAGDITPIEGHVPTWDGVWWERRGDTVRIGLLTRFVGEPGRQARTPLLEHGAVEIYSIDQVRPAGDGESEMVARLTSIVVAAWLLMGQPKVVETTRQETATPKNWRPTVERPIPEVTLLDVHSTHAERGSERAEADSGEAGGEGREYARRWWVSGHWRQQVCGPGRSQRRPTWIAPYVKGPEGKPLVDNPVVKVWRR